MNRYKLPFYVLIYVLTAVAGSMPNSAWPDEGTSEPDDPAISSQPERHRYRAQSYRHDPYPGEIIVDALLVRPLSLAATVVGGGLFVATLPFTALSNQADESAKALVGTPAYHTFSRCLGCLGHRGYSGYGRYGYHYPYYRHYGRHHGYRHGYRHGYHYGRRYRHHGFHRRYGYH